MLPLLLNGILLLLILLPLLLGNSHVAIVITRRLSATPAQNEDMGLTYEHNLTLSTWILPPPSLPPLIPSSPRSYQPQSLLAKLRSVVPSAALPHGAPAAFSTTDSPAGSRPLFARDFVIGMQ
jgi:hypothetical protein